MMSFANLEDGSENVGNRNSSSRLEKLYPSGDNTEAFNDSFKPVNSVPVKAIDSDHEKLSTNRTNWAELPSPAVETIYSFLSRADQWRMSQVCSRWSKDFSSPCLWRKIRFDMPEHDHQSETCLEVKLAQKYGHMFQHVDIICKEVTIDLVGIVKTQLVHFLNALIDRSQLTSIKFIDTEEYFYQLDELEDLDTYEDVLKVVISFFNSQSNLKEVDFRNSRYTIYRSMQLVKAILHSNCNTVSSLKLRRFVNCIARPSSSAEYLLNLAEVCRKVVAVRSLVMDYTLMFEDIINKVYGMLFSDDYQLDKEKPCLSEIEIYCLDIVQKEIFCPGDLMFRGIPPKAWKYLRRVLPDLRVKMHLIIWSHLAEMEKFLVREMPLSSLDFRFEEATEETDIIELISHLQTCKYQSYLEKLSVLWFPPIADFAGSIIPFVQSCGKLQILQLHTESVPNEIEDILKELLENHPMSLKSIHLRFNNQPKAEDGKNLEVLSEAYNSLFELQGIDCSLVY